MKNTLVIAFTPGVLAMVIWPSAAQEGLSIPTLLTNTQSKPYGWILRARAEVLSLKS